MLDYTDYFSARYDVARDKFRLAVAAAGGRLESHLHPTAQGAHGEELAIDVAYVGDPQAGKRLLMISGTHGLEGFAGAALQVGWLRGLAAAPLHPGVGAILVHGLNPYGFSHGSRTTLSGVDLNRNFIDHAAGLPANAGYDALHAALMPSRWSAQTRQATDEALAAFVAAHGEDALFDAFARGQFTQADGLFFGGFAPEWEHLVLKSVVQRHLSQAPQVAVIDWHTGIGEYGLPFFMTFSEPGSEAQAQAAAWWGQDRVLGSRPHGRSRPNYQGLVYNGVQAWLPDSVVTGAVIEFGTRGPAAGALAIRQDHWLRKYGETLPADTYILLKDDLLDSLNPVSYLWRDSVLRHGLDAIQAAIQGLAQWQLSATSHGKEKV